MIRVLNIHRKIDFENGGQSTDEACNVLLVIGQEASNKARFLLTAEEAQELDGLTKKIEQRIGKLLVADYVVPESASENGNSVE